MTGNCINRHLNLMAFEGEIDRPIVLCINLFIVIIIMTCMSGLSFTCRVFSRRIRWRLGGCGRCRRVGRRSGPARRSSGGSSPAAVGRWRRLRLAGWRRYALNGGNKSQLAPSTHHYTGAFVIVKRQTYEIANTCTNAHFPSIITPKV